MISGPLPIAANAIRQSSSIVYGQLWQNSMSGNARNTAGGGALDETIEAIRPAPATVTE